jgi:hypothetical protein
MLNNTIIERGDFDRGILLLSPCENPSEFEGSKQLLNFANYFKGNWSEIGPVPGEAEVCGARRLIGTRFAKSRRRKHFQ